MEKIKLIISRNRNGLKKCTGLLRKTTGGICKVIGRSELSGTKTKIDISDLSNGIYFVRIGSGQNSSIKKLIKESTI
jgi:hypothetical protein